MKFFGNGFRPVALFTFASTLTLTTPSHAARCGGDFNSFVQNISADAASAGISQGVIASALGGVQQDMAVLNFDRRQRYTFNKTFEQYVSTRVGSVRINGGRAMLQRHAALLSSIEARYGVPRQILVAIWGLETDFGKGDMGKLPVFRVLTTMAHDCRRTELFQGELLAALKIVQRGDLPLSQMIGAYAGEIGQTRKPWPCMARCRRLLLKLPDNLRQRKRRAFARRFVSMDARVKPGHDDLNSNYPRSSAASATVTDASASLAPSPRSAGCALWSPRTAGRLLPGCGRCSCRCRSACGVRVLRAG
jgi:hypothetical protein